MADGYNGWTNYETWNMALWVDNEEGIYRAKCRKFTISEPTEKAVKYFCLEWFPDGTPDMEPGDLEKINWEEIAENWAAEFADETEAEEAEEAEND